MAIGGMTTTNHFIAVLGPACERVSLSYPLDDLYVSLRILDWPVGVSVLATLRRGVDAVSAA